jgi:hypothetical protein
MSPTTIQATNAGLFGGILATGGTIYTGKFAGIQTVGVTFGVTGITSALCDNSAYLTGKSFNHPFELNFPFEVIQLTSGAAYIKKRVE